jgi:hypothetical protein
MRGNILRDAIMSWKSSTFEAIKRITKRNRSHLFSRQQILDEELLRIIADAESTGKTPAQTLSRVLQELRNEKKISMNSSGRYRLLH